MIPRKPMLAATATTLVLQQLQYPLLISAKLDGVRALCRGGAVFSRSLKPLPNRELQKLFGARAFDGLDGELIIGDPTAPDCFNRTTSAIMSFSGNISELTYYVFDWLGTPYAHKSFEQRLHDLFEIYEALPSEFRDRIVILDQQRALSPEEATDIEYVMVAQGYEGVILRSPHSPYKHGRSTLREQGMNLDLFAAKVVDRLMFRKRPRQLDLETP